MTKQAKNHPSHPRVRYDEGCLGAHALNLVGDRWALLVVRELVFAAKRFGAIRAGLPGVTASVLTGRLAQLEQAGVVIHDPQAGTYGLTDAGHGLLPVLQALCRWALTVPGHDPRRFISPSALMISMGVTLRAGPDACAGFDFGPEAFQMQLQSGALRTTAVADPQAPFVLRGDGNAMAAAVYGPQPLAALVASGVVQATGDLDLAQRFLVQFSLQPRD